MVKSFAPKLTHIDGEAVLLNIEDGESIRIFGFIISGASTYLFRDANGNNLFQLNTTTSRPINFFIPWIADKGLQILTNSSTCEITLFHSQGGA